jgi:hypothetical protein
MKFLKKASLAASIAAVSFAANAELVAMDEMSMAAATGQAGIDLNVELTGTDAISIGSVVYTDTADADGTDGGSLSISGIRLGVADKDDGTPDVLTIANTIDINSDGDLVIGGTGVNGLLLGVDSVDLSGGANLVSDLALTINMGASTTIISEAGEVLDGAGVGTGVDIDGVKTGATKIDHTGSFEITDGSVNLLDGGIQIAGLKAYNGTEGNAITTDLVMWTDEDALNIKAGFEGTIEFGSIKLGSNPANESIGKVAINGLSMTGATIKISGH